MNEISIEAKKYIEVLLSKINGIRASNHYIDHIAYRIDWGPSGVGDYSGYINLRNSLINYGAKLISEEIVPNNENGRPISIFKLAEKIITPLNPVEYFELPAPRVGKAESRGYTHIEIVINTSLKEFYSINKLFIDQYSVNEEVLKALDFESNNISGNHEIELDFGNNYKVKFHKIPIWDFLKIQYLNVDPNLVSENRISFDSNFPNVLIDN